MATIVNIAIIGAGNIGLRHVKAVVECPSTCLILWIDPHPLPAAIKLAEELGVPLEQNLDSLKSGARKVRGAIVATPNHTHVNISKELLALGIDVLVEKPMSTSVESGEDLLRTAEKHGRKLLVGHHRRFNSFMTAGHDAMSKGIIGKPIAVSGLWMVCKPASYFKHPTAWRASAEQGGGPVLINMIHEVDILQYFFGPVIKVHAEQTVPQRGHPVEEGAAIILKFSSGVVGTFLLCDVTPSLHNYENVTGDHPLIPTIKKSGTDCYRIFGTLGSLSIADMKVTTHAEGVEASWDNPMVEKAMDVREAVPFDEQIAHFARVVNGEEEPRCSGLDGLRALRACSAIGEALKTGNSVEVKV